MTAPAIPHLRMIHEIRSQEPVTAEFLVRETRTVFEQFGIPISQSRVSKLVRSYLRRPAALGFDYGTFIATKLAVNEMDRRLVADELRRVIAYSDPTGETAVANVNRERRSTR